MDREIVYYSDELPQAILAIPAGLQARYIHLTERMLTFGPDLGMPHTRAMGKGLFELRMKSKEGIGRVFFYTQPARRIMIASRLRQEVGQDACQGVESRPGTDERGTGE